MAITANEKAAILASIVGARNEANLGALLDGLNTAVEIATEAANVAAVGTLTAVDTDLAAVDAATTDTTAAALDDVNTTITAQEAFNDQVIADLATLKTAFNAILTSLKAAGLMADA
jgi:hypothetical protein